MPKRIRERKQRAEALRGQAAAHRRRAGQVVGPLAHEALLRLATDCEESATKLDEQNVAARTGGNNGRPGEGRKPG